MDSKSDYAAMDRPELIQLVFYPRKDCTSPPPGATDHFIEVAKGVSIACRFYVHSFKSPSVLLFHGNGEVANDYDFVAPIYFSRGMNLFVADYRGYGCSGGSPSFSSMVADAHHIFKGFEGILHEEDFRGKVILMGRSLGSIPAIELASQYGDRVAGLIIESGFASSLKLMSRLGLPQQVLGIKDPGFPNQSKICTIRLPTLILHGERDSMIPLDQARDLFQSSASEKKRLVIIPEADHNDILMRDIDLYFGAVAEFVSAC